jgi:RNA polymerase I-specific transcription initiation factor RRN3
MYCFTVLEANRRSDAAAALPDVAGRRTASASDPTTPTLLTATPLVQQALHEARMDSHFPFDPYKLPLTAPYLEGRYRIWQAPDGDDEDDDEDEDEDEDGHTMMGAVTIPGQRDDDDDRVVNSFEAMSLSPEGGVRSSQPMSLIV